MPRKISLSGILMATILAVSVVVALTVFGKFRTAQGQVNMQYVILIIHYQSSILLIQQNQRYVVFQ